MDPSFQPFVSVVTPVYNTEKYLGECIESVLRQTYTNWEYLIVDNRSTDKSLQIACAYAKQDSRIRVVENPEFLNIIQNWNNSLRQVSPQSKYCKIVHADDWLFPDCITQMVRVMEEHPNVGIVGAYRLEDAYVNLDGLPYPSEVVPGKEICCLTLMGGVYVFGSPTSLLLRSDMIRNRRDFYNVENIHSDTEVCYEVLRSSDFGFVHQVLTYTRRHNEAATSYSRRLTTFLPGKLTCLVKYGPVYLTKEEYEERLHQAMDEYYRFLAKNVFRRREKEFWEYHKFELQKLGIRISVARLSRYSSRYLMALLQDNLLHPIEFASEIFGFIRNAVGKDSGQKVKSSLKQSSSTIRKKKNQSVIPTP